MLVAAAVVIVVVVVSAAAVIVVAAVVAVVVAAVDAAVAAVAVFVLVIVSCYCCLLLLQGGRLRREASLHSLWGDTAASCVGHCCGFSAVEPDWWRNAHAQVLRWVANYYPRNCFSNERSKATGFLISCTIAPT